MREGISYKVTFSYGAEEYSSVRAVNVVSFDNGEDVIKLARLTLDETDPIIRSVERICKISVGA
jgi:hypothetical protein